MFNNQPIILEGYSAAVFLAQMEFSDKEYVPMYMKTKAVESPNGKITFEKNSNYPYKTKEEERIARYKHEQKQREYIINFLKENYSETDYAERYEKDNKWSNPLRHHNEETKKCECLKEDGRHCNKKRECTTCYTCCFNCLFPIGHCNKGECKYIEG